MIFHITSKTTYPLMWDLLHRRHGSVLHTHFEYRTLDPASTHRSAYRRPSSHPLFMLWTLPPYGNSSASITPFVQSRSEEATRIKYIHASNVWRAADWGGVLLLRERGLHALILQM